MTEVWLYIVVILINLHIISIIAVLNYFEFYLLLLYNNSRRHLVNL